MTSPSSFQERCGRCGFEVSGPDAEYVQRRVDGHLCRPAETSHWYDAVFSFDSLWLIGTVAVVALVVIFGGK